MLKGGYDLLGRTKDQIRTTEQINAALDACTALKLDALVIIGGIFVSLLDFHVVTFIFVYWFFFVLLMKVWHQTQMLHNLQKRLQKESAWQRYTTWHWCFINYIAWNFASTFIRMPHHPELFNAPNVSSYPCSLTTFDLLPLFASTDPLLSISKIFRWLVFLLLWMGILRTILLRQMWVLTQFVR